MLKYYVWARKLHFDKLDMLVAVRQRLKLFLHDSDSHLNREHFLLK
jgi:hypothetical protein